MKPLIRLPLSAFALACLSALPVAAQTAGKTQTGSHGDLHWTAQSLLTGTTHTQLGGPVTNGGDPLYWPSFPRDSGVVALLMDYGPGGAFICSGTLLNDRMSILTAGHCVSDGAGSANPLTTTVFFQPAAGLAAGTRIHTPVAAGVESRTVTQYFVNAAYTGDVIDQNDIAVLRLDAEAPAWASGYGLYTTADLEGQTFMVQGYGALGDGATGRNNFTARLRNGDNRYDFMLGNAAFGTNWATVLGEPFAQIQYSIVSDFDNGLAGNDTSCLVAQASNIAGAGGAQFCNLGTGAREVGVAGGDSGGPSFINGLISSVNSYGLTFGAAWGDALCNPGCLNSSFGEFSGYVPVHIHAQWIESVMLPAIPEPGSYALLALGLLGLAAHGRRRMAR